MERVVVHVKEIGEGKRGKFVKLSVAADGVEWLMTLHADEAGLITETGGLPQFIWPFTNETPGREGLGIDDLGHVAG